MLDALTDAGFDIPREGKAYQHRIAADFDLNQGRVSEIATGKRFSEIPPALMEVSHV